MRYAYRTVEGNNNGLKMDGGDPTSLLAALHAPQSMGSQFGNIIARYLMGFAQIQNNSGGAAAAGIAARIHRERWKFGKWTDASTTFTDQTSQAQNATANDMNLDTSAVNNDGSVFAALDKFNLIDLLVGTANTGGAPVAELAYSGPAGWKVLANAIVAPLATMTVGEQLIWFVMPMDFTPMTVALHGIGVPVGYYGVRIRKTTAATTGALGTSCSLAQAMAVSQAIASNGIVSSPPRAGDYLFECGADSLYGVIGTGHVLNNFSVDVAIL